MAKFEYPTVTGAVARDVVTITDDSGTVIEVSPESLLNFVADTFVKRPKIREIEEQSAREALGIQR